jgi:hypothetical protein
MLKTLPAAWWNGRKRLIESGDGRRQAGDGRRQTGDGRRASPAVASRRRETVLGVHYKEMFIPNMKLIPAIGK